MFNPLEEIQSLMSEFKSDWFIAGGWAIDLFLGKTTRAHGDIEIALFRSDQIALQKYLKDWNLQKVVGGNLSEWKQGEFLELPVHEIHCLNEKSRLSSFEVLLNEKEENVWVYRRNQRISKHLSQVYLTNNLGMKFLRPEIVLLYKSKNPRAKDEQDFQFVVRHLDDESKKWLKAALAICYTQHEWLQKL